MVLEMTKPVFAGFFRPCDTQTDLLSSRDCLHGGESFDFRILKNGGFLSKPFVSGKTLFDISVNTDQICMGFGAETPGKYKQHVHLSYFRTKIWLKSY